MQAGDRVTLTATVVQTTDLGGELNVQLEHGGERFWLRQRLLEAFAVPAPAPEPEPPKAPAKPASKGR